MDTTKLDAKYQRLSQEEVDALPVWSTVYVLWGGGNGPHMYLITRKRGNHSHIDGLSSDSGTLGFVGKEKPLDIVWHVLPTDQELAEVFRLTFEWHSIPTRIKCFGPFVRALKKINACDGPDIEMIVIRAYSSVCDEHRKAVTRRDLLREIAKFRKLDLRKDINRAIVAALENSSERLRPVGWQAMLAEAKERLARAAEADVASGSGVK